MGQEFLGDHDGALYWPSHDCLIVSDLHLEKGRAMASRGLMLPPYDTKDTLHRLENCLKRWQPAMVISLGDSFHHEDSAATMCLEFRHKISQLQNGCTWHWISGNHDPEIPADLGGVAMNELEIDGIIFRHEQHDGAKAEISGHLHPAARIQQRGKKLRRRCFASDGNRLIMPAFGAFTGGLDIDHKAFDNIFDKIKLDVWMLGKSRVYKIAAGKVR